MPFNPELIKVFKSSGKYMNLVHGSSTITFALKECYSHFGVTYNKKFKNYSIGVNVDDKLFSKLKAVESKAESFLERSLSKPLLRCLVERGGYRSLYLKLKPDQFEDEMLNDRAERVGFWNYHGDGHLHGHRASSASRARRRDGN